MKEFLQKFMKGRTIAFVGGIEDYNRIKFFRQLLFFKPDIYVSEFGELFGKQTIKESEIPDYEECFWVICFTSMSEIQRIETVFQNANIENYCKFDQLKEFEKRIVRLPEFVLDGERALFTDRPKAYWNLVNAFFDSRKPLRILEIGVFQASLIQKVDEYLENPIEKYVGVDPYMGSQEDSYFKAYYSNHDDASSYYEYALNEYEKHDYAELHREMSIEYMKNVASRNEEFDVIIIDGDHRYQPCLDDLEAAKKY